jgi:hypothetical protein
MSGAERAAPAPARQAGDRRRDWGWVAHDGFGGPTPDPAAADPGAPVSGVTGRTPYPHPNDDYEQE